MIQGNVITDYKTINTSSVRELQYTEDNCFVFVMGYET